MIGTQLGPYTIETSLGVGGMGTVYEASGPDGPVALKAIHAHLLESPGFFKRFLREAEIGKRVRHENVVRTLDVDALSIDGEPHHFLVNTQAVVDVLRRLARFEALLGEPEAALAHLGDATAAQAVLEELGDRTPVADRMEAAFLIWKATQDTTHLATAHELLMRLAEAAPDGSKDNMLANVPLHRDIVAAVAN